jgi:hypothetical protein
VKFDWALLTRRVIFGATVLVLLFDLFVAAFGGPGSTISLQGWYMTGDKTIPFREKSLLLAVGYLVGHIFGRIDK